MDKIFVWEVTQGICCARVQQYLSEASEALDLIAKGGIEFSLSGAFSVRSDKPLSRTKKIPCSEGRKGSK